MNIKFKLSLQFALIITAILLFFAALVYYFYYNSQLGKFRENLVDTAKNSAILLINVVEVDSTLLKKIHGSTISWEEEEIVITNPSFKIIYSNHPEYLTSTVMKDNASESDISYFTASEKDGIFYRHRFQDKSYYVYAMAFDSSRQENLSDLRSILIWSILISLVLSVYLSYTFSRNAIQPISRLVKSIKAINSSKLNDRLDEGNRQDEIAQLAMSFNEMLKDLEIAFKNQEDFISNASHELRTPLTVMIVESDYLMSRDRTDREYQAHIEGLIEDTRRLNSLINSLLELAHINRDNSVEFSEVRIDEIMYNSIHRIKSKFKDRKILLKLVYRENDNGLFIRGNEGLLNIVFNNLIENACKFSDEEVIIEFMITQSTINVMISDKGIGIPSGQRDSIFGPFIRGSNVKYKSGYGIGLSLVSKILELHAIPIKITSSENIGTKVELTFDRISER